MHVVVFSYMYPSPRHENSGVFVEEFARALVRQAEVDVVSPVPWSPRLLWPLSERWRSYGRQPLENRRHGLAVHHPRYVQPIGQWSVPVAGVSMAVGARRVMARLASRPGATVINVHQLLPDGLAAVLLGRRLGVPVVCTLQGSDVTAVPFHDRGSRAAARFVARRASAFIAVEQALVECLREVAPDHARAVTIPCGVDVERFRPHDRTAVRQQLGLAPDDKIVLFAGLLIARKGVDVLLKAFARVAPRIPEARLVLVGGSTERDDRRAELTRMAGELGCAERVKFAGRRPHDEMPLWYSAADVFTLPSRLEGFPNVVREAIACGTPSVVTALPGIREAIGPSCGTECGLVVPVDDVDALAAALDEALRRNWDRAALRRRAEAWRWARNVEESLEVFSTAGASAREVAR